MKAWLATGVVLLVAGTAVAVLLTDHGLWRSDASSSMDATVHVRNHEQTNGGNHRGASRRPESPYALRPAPRHLPVNVEFAPSQEPRAGILFNVHTGRVLWEHDP